MRSGISQFGSGMVRRIGRASHWRRLLSAVVAGAFIVAALAAGTGEAQASDRVHIVAPGENLAKIAARYNTTLAELAQYNNIANPDIVRIGQQLAIPYDTRASLNAPAANPQALPGDAGYYHVQRGDSLSMIAQAHGLAMADLLRLNGLENPNHIYVGQTLRLSARVDSPSTRIQVEPALADAIHVVKEGDSLAQIAKQYGMTVEEAMRLNGLPNPNFVWTGQRLRVNQAPSSAEQFSMAVAGAPAYGHRLIEIDLSAQTLTAWQGDVPVLRTVVSSGKASTPTVTGRFAVYHKLDSQRMTGPDYDLPGVPWVMYFYGDYAIHGAYWHNSFGVPTSHGCVNLTVEDAQALYNWASEGTEVWVH